MLRLPQVDVLIIGGGPSGLSAALTLVRQNHSVIVFDTNNCRALPSRKLHGISTSDGKPPAEYLTNARAELTKYHGFQAVEAEIVSAVKLSDARFEVRDCRGETYQGKQVILANGVKDYFPGIEGYAEAWGKAIFHNPFAQGRHDNASSRSSGVLAVEWIAMPRFAMHLTHLLSQLTPNVTIYTHGDTELASTLQSLLDKAEDKPSTVKVDARHISRLALHTEEAVSIAIHFTEGGSATESFLGHAPVTKLNGPFAEQLGIDISSNASEYVVNGPTNVTNIEGVYAAGDSMSMFKVWPNAIASGAVTGAGVAVNLQERRWGLESIFG